MDVGRVIAALVAVNHHSSAAGERQIAGEAAMRELFTLRKTKDEVFTGLVCYFGDVNTGYGGAEAALVRLRDSADGWNSATAWLTAW